MFRKILIGIIAIVAAGIIVANFFSLAPSMQSFLKLRIIEHNPNVTFYLGNGGNSGLLVGEEKALLIDTKFGGFSKKLYKKTTSKIDDKELIVVNTHFHTDHAGGNHLYDGSEIIAGDYGQKLWLSENKDNSLPTNWIDGDTTFNIGGINVNLIHIGSNHTRNDLFIYIPEYKLLFAGDVYSHATHPVIRESSFPNVDHWEKTLSEYANSTLEIDTVIPGHGNLAVKKDLQLAAQYFRDIKFKTKREVRKKYRSWYRLPFMATSGRNWAIVNEGKGNYQP